MKNSLKLFLSISIVVATMFCLVVSANAGPAWEFRSAGNSYNNNTWDFAAVFTVNSNVTVTGLGYYADPNNGQVDANPVALYSCNSAACDSTGTLLASATVTNVYPLFDHFRYVTIPDVTLVPGQSYEVAGVSFADNYTWNDPGFSTDPAITYNLSQTRWQLLNTPDFLNTLASFDIVSDGYWGPNVFLGQPSFATPEPTSILLLASGLIGLAAFGRKRSQKN